MTIDQPLDDLTGLPLRGAFVAAAREALATAKATDGHCALLVVDVDEFKQVNDAHGHLVGDALLKLVAEVLRRTLRGGDIPARWGGDEFVALLPGAPIERARDVAERLAAAIRGHAPVDVRGVALPRATVSIGVSAFPAHGADAEALFAAADRAMYHVKRRGRDGVAVAGGPHGVAMVPALDRFVGRSEELRGLVRLLDEAVQGTPRLVVVLGEAGVGKSTLLRQLEPEVRLRGGSLVVGRSLDGVMVQPPYAPWIEVVEALERLDQRTPLTEAAPPLSPLSTAATSALPTPASTPSAASLATLFADGGLAPLGLRLPTTPSQLRAINAQEPRWPELSRIVPSLSRPGSVPAPSGSKFTLLVELATYIAAAARRRPLVIVLDDLQRADAASWDALEHVATQLEGEPILLCITLRMEAVTSEVTQRMQRLVRNERARELPLARLSRDELRRWVETAFFGQDLGREFLAFLYRQTEGNPLLVVQTLRTLVDEGAIWWADDRWHHKPASELRLPVGVMNLMARRLTKLTPEAQDVLTVAAVVGREFDVGVVADAAHASPEAMTHALENGIRASVVHPAHGRGGDRFVFSHTLLMEALRQTADARRLQQIHERVAGALRVRVPDAVPEIAMHYDRADDAGEAYTYALRASDRARRVYAHDEADEFLRIAERHAPDAAALASVRVMLAEVAEARGRYAEAEELAALALDWYAPRDDVASTLRLRRLRLRLRALLGEPAQATLEECAVLLREAMQAGADDERVALLGMMATTHLRLGDRTAAVQFARQAVALAERLPDPLPQAEALVRLGVALDADDAGEAEGSYRRALSLYEAAHDVRGQARCWDRLGVLAAQRGQWSEARSALRKAIDLGRTAGTPDEWGVAALDMGVVARRTGDLAQARELFGEALALFAAVQNSERQLLALYHLAHLDRERGELRAAAGLYEAAASLARRVGQHEVEVGAISGAGLCHFHLGQRSLAQESLQRAELLVGERDDWFPGRELLDALAIELLAAMGDGSAAGARFVEAFDRAREADRWASDWLAAEVNESLSLVAPDLLPRLRLAQAGVASATRMPKGASDAMKPLS